MDGALARRLLVGQQAAIAELRRLSGSTDGEGRLVWVSGPAGVGKSHLIRTFLGAGTDATTFLIEAGGRRSPLRVLMAVVRAMRRPGQRAEIGLPAAEAAIGAPPGDGEDLADLNACGLVDQAITGILDLRVDRRPLLLVDDLDRLEPETGATASALELLHHLRRIAESTERDIWFTARSHAAGYREIVSPRLTLERMDDGDTFERIYARHLEAFCDPEADGGPFERSAVTTATEAAHGLPGAFLRLLRGALDHHRASLCARKGPLTGDDLRRFVRERTAGYATSYPAAYREVRAALDRGQLVVRPAEPEVYRGTPMVRELLRPLLTDPSGFEVDPSWLSLLDPPNDPDRS